MKTMFDPADYKAIYKDWQDRNSADAELIRLYEEGSTQPYSGAEISALQRYSGSSYAGLNKAEFEKALRAGEVRETDLLRGLDGAMSKASLPDDMKTYRGLSNRVYNDWKGRIERGEKTIVDDAYLSASVSLNVAEEFGPYQVEIYMPRGTRAISIAPVSKIRGELEILLARASDLQYMGVNADSGMMMFLVGP